MFVLARKNEHFHFWRLKSVFQDEYLSREEDTVANYFDHGYFISIFFRHEFRLLETLSR